MQWAKQLKDEYSKITKKNMAKGGKGIKVDKSGSTLDSNKQVAKDVGFKSKENYRKANYIYENGNRRVVTP